MAEELVLREKTEVAKYSQKPDILAIYGVPQMFDVIAEKNKSDLLKVLNIGSTGADTYAQLKNAKQLVIEIPGEFREMVNSGKAFIDKSQRIKGAYAATIRDAKTHQVLTHTVAVEQINPVAVTQCLSNIAMMASMQAVLEKLEAIEEVVEDVKNGQEDDRVAKVIGAFKSFVTLYPTIQTQEEMCNEANRAFHLMEEGLAQLHKQIERDREKIKHVPNTDLKSILWGWVPFYHRVDICKDRYNKFIYDLQLYNRLILLSDFVLFSKDNSNTNSILRNHREIVEYCNIYIDDKFQQDMRYLMHNDVRGIEAVLNYNKNINEALDNMKMSLPLQIPCDANNLN